MAVKSATTFEEQIEILRSRNLTIENDARAREILSRVNYYRLSAYTLTLKKQDVFQPGTTLEDVFALHEFDKHLRAILMRALETIEISFRTHIAYLLAHKYGPLGYLIKNNFDNHEYHQSNIKQLQTELDRSDEVFIHHHRQKYSGEFPIWVAIEVTSFGLLSKFYSNLVVEDQDQISKEYYNSKVEFLKTWLHSLAYLRNLCAHYGRLYNRRVSITPKLFRSEKKLGIAPNTIFALIMTIGRFLRNTNEWDFFITNLAALTESYEQVDLSKLGFIDNWEEYLRNL